MSHAQQVASIITFIPVLILIGVGLLVTLRSGNVRLGTVSGVRQLAGNATHTAILVAVSLGLMLFAQSFAGFNLTRLW